MATSCRYSITVRPAFLVAVAMVLNSPPIHAQRSKTPRFEDYPVTEMFTGRPAAPILVSPELRHYRTRIRNGVSTGSDVWIGSYKNPIEARGPNFAGHYFVIRWGCGSQCVTMAIVDAKTGIVYRPPLTDQVFLHVPLDNLSDMETDVRPNSTLMILRTQLVPRLQGSKDVRHVLLRTVCRQSLFQ